MHAPAVPTARPAAKPAVIISPIVDFLCVGGLSLIVFVPLLLSGRSDLVIVGAGVQAFLGTVLNMPHFMASYRIVYRSKEMILRHKWATIYIPTLLVAYIALALWQARESPWLLYIIAFVASAYLAWHYTGQVWGMMASYSHLGGRPFDTVERRLIRGSLRILLAWHVSWTLYGALRNPQTVLPLYTALTAGTALAFVLGAIGLIRMWRRTGQRPATNALVAWVAIFVWYAMMARDPKALFWIQIAHSLQYLVFPVRVEVNRTQGEIAASPSTQSTAGTLARHMAFYGFGLLAVSVLIALVVPAAPMSILGDFFGETGERTAPILVLIFINIHHYFTDGVIWKISNPEVRKDLFSHVRREGDAGRAGGTTSRGKHKKKKRHGR